MDEATKIHSQERHGVGERSTREDSIGPERTREDSHEDLGDLSLSGLLLGGLRVRCFRGCWDLLLLVLNVSLGS